MSTCTTALAMSLLSTTAAEISIADRSELPLVLMTPAGPDRTTSRSEITRRIAAPFDEHTDLDVRLVDAPGGLDCEGNLRCIYGTVRTAIVGDTDSSDLLLVFSKLAGADGRVRLAWMLVDTARAEALYAKSSIGEIDEAVIRRETASADLAGVRDVIHRMVEEKLRPILDAMDHWHPYGTIEFESTHRDRLFLDTRLVGEIDAGMTRVTNVRAGSIVIRVEHDRARPYTKRIDVASGASTFLTVPYEPLVDPNVSAIRSATLWGGTSVAALGVGLAGATSVVGIAERPLCFSSGDRGCGIGLRYRRALGVPIAPMTTSIALAGMTWVAGTFLEPKDRMPWWTLAAGVVVGVGTYLLLAALETDVDDL